MEAWGKFGKIKMMQLPRYVLVGHGVLEEVAAVCKRLKLSGVALVVTGSTTRRVAGEGVLEMLADSGYDCGLVEVRSASTESVEKVKSVAEECRATFMIAVGGGKVIDVAKVASCVLDVPFISVPTIASHDGIASPRASIKDKGVNTSVAAQAPLAIIADTKIIAEAPHRFLAAGCGDIISNYTAVMDWRLAHRLKNAEFSSYAAALSEMTAKMIMERSKEIKPNLEESAWIVVKALVSSGVAISIAGSSAPASGAEHKFSHALDMIAPKPALHGEQCGVGAIMMSYLHGAEWKYVRDALRNVGAPTNAKELGIKDEYIIEALVQAHKINPERYTILGDTGLTYEAAERLATITEVI